MIGARHRSQHASPFRTADGPGRGAAVPRARARARLGDALERCQDDDGEAVLVGVARDGRVLRQRDAPEAEEPNQKWNWTRMEVAAAHTCSSTMHPRQSASHVRWQSHPLPIGLDANARSVNAR